MYSFRNDYSDGAHPDILKAMLAENDILTDGYGEDVFTAEAEALLKKSMNTDDVDIHLIAGGTLTNLTAISAFLRPHEAVIAAQSGHICVHETGAVEATGHKVITVESPDGKIRPDQISRVCREHHFEHMVKPALVYISQTTETGTLYRAAELSALRECCRAEGLLLYIDGARLGSALTSEAADLSLPDYPSLCDAFYIGGTKNGALFGEALVICNDDLKMDFRFHLKQKGALLAKGRHLGIQFRTLFENNLYFELAKKANRSAARLQRGIEELGFGMLFRSHTNQIFPVFPDDIIAELEKEFLFYRWGKTDETRSAVRLVCSWATKDEEVDLLLKKLGSL